MHVESVLITKNGKDFFKLRKELWDKSEKFYTNSKFRKATDEEVDSYAKKHGLIHEEEE